LFREAGDGAGGSLVNVTLCLMIFRKSTFLFQITLTLLVNCSTSGSFRS